VLSDGRSVDGRAMGYPPGWRKAYEDEVAVVFVR